MVLVFDPVNQQTPEPTINVSIPESVVIGESFKLSITIIKNNLNSFAKAQLNLPSGFIPEPIETENAKFLFEEKTIKFIWDRMPSKPELIICMNINTENASEGIKGISGVFAYLDGSVKKEKYIQSSIIKIEEPSTASIPKGEVAPSHKTPESSDQQDQLEYRIQIAAASNRIDIKELANKHNIEKLLKEEIHNGLLKYTVGPYSTYNIARKQQSYYRITKGVKGAFIITYKKGKRIP